MNIYKHYKSKLYRYLGVVKHSETLEELVSYQCLYENNEGQFWVRPKQMFFENVTQGSDIVPRFQKLELSFETFTSVTPDKMQQLVELGTRIFPGFDSQAVLAEWKKLAQYQLVLASLDEKAIGFKLAYPLTRDMYFSWLDGVLPEFQGLGVASELAEQFEQNCADDGYRKLVAKPLAHHQKSLILLLHRDFAITGTEHSSSGLRVICEKNIFK